MSVVVDLLSGALLLAGSVLALAAGVALLRFPDLLSRVHASTKPAVVGLLMVLTAAALQVATPRAVVGLVLVAVFQLVTAPVAAHLVTRAAYREGRSGLDRLLVDELADAPPDRGGRRATPG
jgi:multicomponent Na+:H+ antiporter subunit G